MDRTEFQNSPGRQFRLIKRIGKGGFGEVYLAEMSTPSGFTKTVAVKLLRTDIEQIQATAQRMRDEARLLGMLRHRAIVQAEDLITLAGRTAVVMEYIPGVNHSWIIHPKRFEEDIPPRVVLSIIGHIADALDAAYHRPSTVTGKPLQVLHRDIKPGNVRVTPDGEVKVLDFGIARSDHMDREASTTEYQLGSLPYMAPELMAGKSASPSSDVYSLGVCFYESLGRRRFGWAGDEEDSHGTQINTRFSDINWTSFGEAAEAAEKLLRSMLAFDPRERPTARAVLENCRELEHTAPGDSLETWAPTALDRIKTPEDPDGDLGELVGQTLFEEVSTSAQDKKAFMEQLDEATMALSEQEMSSARRQVHEQLEKKPSKTRDRLVLVVLLLAALGTVYVSFFQTADPPVADREAMRERAKAKAELEALLASEANQDLVDAETPDEPGLELDPDEPGLEVAPSEAPAPPKSKAASLPFTDPTPTLEPPVAAEHLEPVSVRISSKPFMIPVLVDGKPVGNTPISNLSLSPGPHVLLFQDGENALRKEIMVTPDGKALWTYLQAEHKVQ